MTPELRLLFLIFSANMLIILIYLLVHQLKGTKAKKHVYICAFVMFLCPVAGPCLFGLANLVYWRLFSKPVDLDGVVFSKIRVKPVVRADEENERNMVPLEEAMEVTDTEGLRNLMMNIVRGDISKSLATLALALNCEDTETAHYAASMLQDALNTFRMNVQREFQRITLKTEPLEQRVRDATLLIDYMNQVLEQNVFTEIEQLSYIKLMDEVCELLYSLDKEKITSAHFEAISMRLLGVGDYDNCQKWCERAEYQYPNILSTYTCQLKLYLNSGQRERFFRVIDELKKSSIVIDSETLELLRVFH